MKRSAAALAAAIACGCGGQLPGSPDGGLDGAADAAGWTTCTSPNGQRVCKGPNHCPLDSRCEDFSGCWNGDALGAEPASTDNLGVCLRSPGQTSDGCWAATDGKVCISFIPPKSPSDWNGGTGDFQLGLLYLQNGAGGQVRYADWGTFDGTPLPAPSTCPTLQNVRICGGNCGGCAQDDICHGRSPLHPYGFCTPSLYEACNMTKPKCSNANNDCFAFKVQPEAQALADKYALCVPKAACPELQSQYPGGGKCAGL
jgi:hypothetical protein